jgi:PilZ domain-containing protein
MNESTGTRRSNRRLTARRACHLVVRYRSLKDWHPASVLDLSMKGCRLRVGEDLARGSAVRVAFESPLRDGATTLEVEVEGNVIWSRREGLSYQAGIHFGDVPMGLDDILEELA